MSDLISPADGVAVDPSWQPHRILFVSANIGAGHHATARAVEQAARRLWPGIRTRWVDALDVMGPGIGPTFRQIYVTNVQTTPWLYEFFYGSLWRYGRFAAASKRVVGAWCGRRLESVIQDYAPDLIVSTYPFGSAGLQWLRQHRSVDVPIAAWVSDFAPHPFWIYRDLDMHFVMHDACVRPARSAESGAAVRVAAPPVNDAFGPADRVAARNKLGLEQDSFIALLSCGYFGFGTVEKAVDTLLATDERVQLVAVCGHNEELRKRLLARGTPPERLSVLGWVEEMPTYVAAADVVVTNAGGATSLEAMACGRTLLMFEPIAAHGRANAELMAQAGLALLCRSPQRLRETVQEMLDHPERLAALEQSALDHAESRTREDDLRLLAGEKAATAGSTEAGSAAYPSGRRLPRLRRLQPEDAFFLHTDTPDAGQLLGGVVYLQRPVDLATARAEIGSRLPGLPNLRRRLVGGRSGWRRPGWLFEERIDVAAHVSECVLGADGEPETFGQAVNDFFSTPLDLGKPPWELRMVRDPRGGQSGLVVKLHHVLGDGFAAIDSMAGLLEEVPEPGEPTEDAGGRDENSTPPGPRGARLFWQRATRVGTGTYHLARSGRAPRSALNGPMTGQRRHALVSLPVPEVRAMARAVGSGSNALLLAIVADGLSRLLDSRGERVAEGSLRIMIPRTIRRGDNLHALGNITAGVPLDLALDPVEPLRRLEQVQAGMQASLDGGQPEASRFLIKSTGLLPASLAGRLARVAYSARWFNVIVSAIPGPQRPQTFAGVRMTEVYPVLPLADGVGVSVGIMRWSDAFAIGLTGDRRLLGDVDRLAATIREASADFRAAALPDAAEETGD